MSAIYYAKHALGNVVEGECLCASDGFSARYDLDRINGTFSRPSHKLFGQSYKDKILVLDKGKLIESGNHEELMQNKGIYFELNNSHQTVNSN